MRRRRLGLAHLNFQQERLQRAAGGSAGLPSGGRGPLKGGSGWGAPGQPHVDGRQLLLPGALVLLRAGGHPLGRRSHLRALLIRARARHICKSPCTKGRALPRTHTTLLLSCVCKIGGGGGQGYCLV